MTNPWTVLATIYVLAKGKIYLAKDIQQKVFIESWLYARSFKEHKNVPDEKPAVKRL